MENTKNAPLIELHEKQLVEWEHLRDELNKENKPDARIGMCERRITNIKAEIVRLKA